MQLFPLGRCGGASRTWGGALAGGPGDIAMTGHVLLEGSLIGFRKRGKGRQWTMVQAGRRQLRPWKVQPMQRRSLPPEVGWVRLDVQYGILPLLPFQMSRPFFFLSESAGEGGFLLPSLARLFGSLGLVPSRFLAGAVLRLLGVPGAGGREARARLGKRWNVIGMSMKGVLDMLIMCSLIWSRAQVATPSAACSGPWSIRRPSLARRRLSVSLAMATYRARIV